MEYKRREGEIREERIYIGLIIRYRREKKNKKSAPFLLVFPILLKVLYFYN